MNKEYGIEWVDEVIDNEGIGYFLTSYCDLHKIEDMELRILCLEAEEAILKIQNFLDKNSALRLF